MKEVISQGGGKRSGGLQSAGSIEDHNEDAPKKPKSNLSRCAACYNHKASMMARWGGDGESSSSAEDSGPEVDSESETESSSSSSCFEEDLSETPEDPSPGPGGQDGGGQDGGGREEGPRRAPVVTCSSPIPHLAPLSQLPRPHTVISTLHLQVLPQNQEDGVHIVQQQLSGREEEKTGGGGGGGGSATPPQSPQWQQVRRQWQQQMSYQQQPFGALSAQGQRLPTPPMHTLPVPPPPMLHPPLQGPGAPHTHLHAPTPPPPCWCWYSVHPPYLH